MNSNLRIIVTIIFLVGLFSCKKKQEKIKPTVESITESVYASGIVKSKNQYQVFSTVSGLLEEIIADEGSLVKKGDPILKLSNESGKLNNANARLANELAKKNVDGDKLDELKANMEFTKLKAKNDSLLFIRQKNLYSKQIGTLIDLEQKELTYKNSLTNFNTAKYRYEDTKTQVEYAARQAKNNLELSSSQQNDFIIRSETDGQVYSILKEKGELVNSLSPVAIVGDANNFELELQVDEYDITRVKSGQKVVLSMDSYKNQTFEAEISRVNLIMNERTRSFTVCADFIVKPERLFANLTVEANIVIRTKNNALTIPRSYLVDDTFVLNEKNEKVKVEVGLEDYKKAEIVSGINASNYILMPVK